MKGNVLNQTTMSLRQNETSYTIIFWEPYRSRNFGRAMVHGATWSIWPKNHRPEATRPGFLAYPNMVHATMACSWRCMPRFTALQKGSENHGWNHDIVKVIHELYFKWKPESIFICFFIWFVSSISAPFLSIASFMAEDEARKLEKDRTGYFGGERARVAIGGPQPINAESWTSKWGLGRHFII